MKRVIQIALQEEGYLEKKSISDLNDKIKNAGDRNYTKYWRDLCPSLQGNPWCGCFIAWIFTIAYGKTNALKLLCATEDFSYYTPTMANYFKKSKRFYNNNPEKGDIIFFKNSQRICHVALIYKTDDKYIYTIEGNTSSRQGVVANGGGVFCKKYLRNNSRIAGFGRPDYNQISYENPYSKPTLLFQKGAKGENVKWLQYALNNVGYNLKVDGIFGELTEKAILDYKKKNNLEVTGLCDELLLNKL